MADGWSLPECMVTGDHYWHGGSVCSACGARLRCACGAFMRADSFEAHFARCPSLVDLGEKP
jgi:hypothetical protein